MEDNEQERRRIQTEKWLAIAPPSEVAVLEILAEHGECHGLLISKVSKGAITDAAIYSLLERLSRRGLIQRREVFQKREGMSSRRVLYSIKPDPATTPPAQPASPLPQP